MLSNTIELSRSHELPDVGVLYGDKSTLTDTVMEIDRVKHRPRLWEVPSVSQVNKRKLYACRWRYVNGRWVCR